MPDKPQPLSASDVNLVHRILGTWPMYSSQDHLEARAVFDKLVEGYNTLLEQSAQSQPDNTEHSHARQPSRIIELQAMVWEDTKEALQELKDWGAPLVELDVQNPRELALRMASGGTVQPGSWDIIVKYEDGEFAVFSRLNTAPIFSERRR